MKIYPGKFLNGDGLAPLLLPHSSYLNKPEFSIYRDLRHRVVGAWWQVGLETFQYHPSILYLSYSPFDPVMCLPWVWIKHWLRVSKKCAIHGCDA